jgi:hypothetical protein
VDENFISGPTTLIQEFNNGRLLHTFYVEEQKVYISDRT